MGVELIYDKDPFCFGIEVDGALDVVEKVFFGSSVSDGGGKDLSESHLEVGNQRLGAVTDVFELATFLKAGFGGSCGMLSL